jgi:hypothetical protein
LFLGIRDSPPREARPDRALAGCLSFSRSPVLLSTSHLRAVVNFVPAEGRSFAPSERTAGV